MHYFFFFFLSLSLAVFSSCLAGLVHDYHFPFHYFFKENHHQDILCACPFCKEGKRKRLLRPTTTTPLFPIDNVVPVMYVYYKNVMHLFTSSIRNKKKNKRIKVKSNLTIWDNLYAYTRKLWERLRAIHLHITFTKATKPSGIANRQRKGKGFFSLLQFAFFCFWQKKAFCFSGMIFFWKMASTVLQFHLIFFAYFILLVDVENTAHLRRNISKKN